jgi:hypothetical protein
MRGLLKSRIIGTGMTALVAHGSPGDTASGLVQKAVHLALADAQVIHFLRRVLEPVQLAALVAHNHRNGLLPDTKSAPGPMP